MTIRNGAPFRQASCDIAPYHVCNNKDYSGVVQVVEIFEFVTTTAYMLLPNFLIFLYAVVEWGKSVLTNTVVK